MKARALIDIVGLWQGSHITMLLVIRLLVIKFHVMFNNNLLEDSTHMWDMKIRSTPPLALGNIGVPWFMANNMIIRLLEDSTHLGTDVN